jgi:hypothetical protein
MSRLRIAGALLLAFVAAGASQPASLSLADRYRGGKIALRLDEDWTSNLPADLVFESRGDVAAAPDGSVFVSNTTRHVIYKFDPNGKFVRAFGRQGQGPGDLTHPGRLSILDGDRLVVGEYATNQRISLFDLDGKFIKIVPTGRFTSQVQALKGGKIAYVSLKNRAEAEAMVSQAEVMIVDSRTGSQKCVARRELRSPFKKGRGGAIILYGQNSLLLAGASDGCLIVGATDSPRLEVFSADGAKLRTIETGWPAIPVTPAYRARYAEKIRREAAPEERKFLDDGAMLPEALNPVKDIAVDADGNVLVWRRTGCLEDCRHEVRAYSAAGEAIGDFTVDPGRLALAPDPRFRRIVFTAGGLIGLLEITDDPDGFLHLFKTDWRRDGPAAPGFVREPD